MFIFSQKDIELKKITSDYESSTRNIELAISNNQKLTEKLMKLNKKIDVKYIVHNNFSVQLPTRIGENN